METILNAFRIAFAAIFTNKTRSFLTMLGVIIGVGSVILLTSIGSGLQKYVTEQFNSFGATNLFVLPGDIFGEDGGFSAEAQQNSFTNNKLELRDVAALSKLREHINFAIPEYTAYAEVKYQQVGKKVTVYGTNAKYSQISGTKMEKGAFFSDVDDLTNQKVAVLGSKIATDLFKTVDPVGKNIRVGSQTFRVVGVAEKKGGGFGGPTFDAYVYVPATTAMQMFNATHVSQITVQAKSKEDMDLAKADIKKELGKRLKSDEFSVIDQTQLLNTINQILGALTAGLGGIAAISLVVGGIGILNIMLVSVIERTREIGLRKALGATPNVILVQFLIEAATLSIFGGMIGTTIAYLLSLAVQQFIPAQVTPEAVALAFSVSAIIGIVFGVIPARRASQLSPIEALRYE